MKTFRNLSGPLFDGPRMRALEARAMASGQVTGAALMERAGQGVVAAVLDRWPALDRPGARALLLAGPGNNGGDGFVVARLLAARGWQVDLRLLGARARLRGDAAAMAARWTGAVAPLADDVPLPGADLVVDALFGTGLARPFEALPRLQAQLADWGAAEAGPRIVAVDVPSGLSADTGTVPGRAEGPRLAAHLTVSFHAAKLGHVLAAGPAACGALAIADIGLAPFDDGTGPRFARLSPDLPKRGGHKFSHGHALVLAGPAGHGGAARMAARAALRVGAGLVTLACPDPALAENAARLDAVMLRGLGPDEGAGLAALLGDPRISALCLGPGLGVERAAALLGPALASGRGLVIDADALTALAAEGAAGLRRGLGPGMVLTPHGGEFARLCPDLGQALSEGRIGRAAAAAEAAARLGAVVLLKGPDTVIAAPDGRLAVAAAVYDAAVPWLATAGAGDVLAGIIAGLVARGIAPFAAAETAALLHAAAARAFGPGLIAEDLPDRLPGVLAALEPRRLDP
ncbi:NAD(P)H-hydrate dehydratase [Frigidibacter sp. MR17.24]|uniref:NAD(P)H-hydrate dehydratase n=1 Tax=Frigidibacter sp. MR17.24 TaxID=3127345 RepID=UPI003012EE48